MSPAGASKRLLEELERLARAHGFVIRYTECDGCALLEVADGAASMRNPLACNFRLVLPSDADPCLRLGAFALAWLEWWKGQHAIDLVLSVGPTARPMVN